MGGRRQALSAVGAMHRGQGERLRPEILPVHQMIKYFLTIPYRIAKLLSLGCGWRNVRRQLQLQWY